MKELRKIVAQWAGFLGIVGVAALLAGCQTQGEAFAEWPGSGGAADTTVQGGGVDVFHIGDVVQITFASPGTTPIFLPHEERIKEDGTITPPRIKPVKAVGRTPGDLQRELQEQYDYYYRNVTITVKAGDRYYYVDGEVTQRGPKPYLGQTDIVKAISSAGGFTEFARKTRVKLIHPDGRTETINYNKAIEDSSYNVPVYPGDQIWVPRRLF
jgi:polysaccharide biosynthesis/export protein